MLVIYSIIFGVVQGLTEFLPVSSSGHLVILHYWVDLNLTDSLSFDVALHVGTLLALFLFFWSEVIKLLKGFFVSLTNWDLSNNPEQRLAWMILVASLPVFIIGYLTEDLITEIFRSVSTVGILLIAFGLLFFFYEKLGLKNNNISDLSWGQAIKIGVAQVFALIPGVSRSGITIIAGLGENLKREEAAKFSFLLAIPAVFGAGVKKIYDLSQVGLAQGESLIFAVGLLSSLIVGYFSIKFFLRYLKNNSLNIFGWYRILVGIIVLFFYYYGQ